jgi:hypothetical protein
VQECGSIRTIDDGLDEHVRLHLADVSYNGNASPLMMLLITDTYNRNVFPCCKSDHTHKKTQACLLQGLPGSNLHPRLTKSNTWEWMESQAKLPEFKGNRPYMLICRCRIPKQIASKYIDLALHAAGPIF